VILEIAIGGVESPFLFLTIEITHFSASNATADILRNKCGMQIISNRCLVGVVVVGQLNWSRSVVF